ncbi:MAG: MotE family protein [Myxococcota bacterium]
MKRRDVNPWILFRVGVALLLVATPSAAETPEEGGATASVAPERIEIDPDALKDGNTSLDLLNAPGLSRGVDSIIAEIRKREVDLALREQRVAERERAVVELEDMIEKRAKDLDRIRQEVEDRISEWSRQGRDRVQQLADVYAAMPPEKAGKLLDKLDLDLAVSVVRSMKKKSSAGVLATMRADRALLVSRRMLRPLDPTTDAPAARAR